MQLVSWNSIQKVDFESIVDSKNLESSQPYLRKDPGGGGGDGGRHASGSGGGLDVLPTTVGQGEPLTGR